MGTSGSEILHFVAIPSDADVGNDETTFIQASRLSPSGHSNVTPSGQPCVRQILLLPNSSKACVLCNGTVSFYSLPELSPVFPNREPTGVQWIGGVDEDEEEGPDGPLVLIANSRRVLLVRVGEKLRPVKTNIEYPQCLQASRRGTIACVADSASYALVDIEHQQKIPLFPISSISQEDQGDANIGQEVRDTSPSGNAQSPNRPPLESAGHSRSTSLGSFLTPGRQSSPKPASNGSRNLKLPETESSRSPSRRRSSTEGEQSSQSTSANATSSVSALRPNLVSPSANEFLLTTGTADNEPGVGMFVNLDGDVVRGTIEFTTYPSSVIVAGNVSSVESRFNRGTELDDQMIYALIVKTSEGGNEIGVEIQPMPGTAAAQSTKKAWLPIQTEATILSTFGLQRTLTPLDHSFSAVSDLLRLVRYRDSVRTPPQTHMNPSSDPRTRAAVEHVEEERALFETQQDEAEASFSPENEKQRAAEQEKFARSLGLAQSQLFIWHGTRLWQVLKTPPVLELEWRLSRCAEPQDSELPSGKCDLKGVLSILAGLQGQEPRNESEFLTYKYIRQKASLLLLVDLWKCMQASNDQLGERPQAVEATLLDSDLDPRVILLKLPGVQKDIRQGSSGIWIHHGLVEVLKSSTSLLPWTTMQDCPVEFWFLIRRYLSAWQEKRGYASIMDEQMVFESVDAALLRVLLHLDHSLAKGSGLQSSTRAKLNNVVDHWKSDFRKAVEMLEEYERLFVLSRLYQSQKMAKNVLDTWRRIANGENDLGGELSPQKVEDRVRNYLVNLSNSSLVEEYSMWLAKRNPDLAIQLFTDDTCRVKFAPADVVTKLKAQAPDAVQMYLEHLVFNKQLDRYADDLIGYYLDSVLNVLESSPEARQSLSDSYTTYRALEKPKPTYINFIRDNAPDERWWHSRLRLLQLLGSGNYSTSASSSSNELTYSIATVLDRLAPFSEYLVSESIILDARQGRHKEALQLLTHGLGDYDTAIRYCYFGGPISSSTGPLDSSLLPSRDTQSDLFGCLLDEFLAIQDSTECLERTTELLGKFAAWFDPLTVFNSVPSGWPVNRLGEFILRSFRALISEHHEAVILKALSASQNLQGQAAFVEACEKFGMKIETDTVTSREDVQA